MEFAKLGIPSATQAYSFKTGVTVTRPGSCVRNWTETEYISDTSRRERLCSAVGAAYFGHGGHCHRSVMDQFNHRT
jgi:hypothetical protein